MDLIKKGITEHEQLDSQISAEQIRLLYGSLKFSLGASFVVAVIMYFSLMEESDSRANLDIWALCVLIVFFIRTIDAIHFTYSQEKKSNN